jgi:hypothetical protein
MQVEFAGPVAPTSKNCNPTQPQLKVGLLTSWGCSIFNVNNCKQLQLCNWLWPVATGSLVSSDHIDFLNKTSLRTAQMVEKWASYD